MKSKRRIERNIDEKHNPTKRSKSDLQPVTEKLIEDMLEFVETGTGLSKELKSALENPQFYPEISKEVKRRDPENKLTPLMIASKNGQVEAVSYLLKNGAVYTDERNERTEIEEVLGKQAYNQSPKILKLLLAAHKFTREQIEKAILQYADKDPPNLTFLSILIDQSVSEKCLSELIQKSIENRAFSGSLSLIQLAHRGGGKIDSKLMDKVLTTLIEDEDLEILKFFFNNCKDLHLLNEKLMKEALLTAVSKKDFLMSLLMTHYLLKNYHFSLDALHQTIDKAQSGLVAVIPKYLVCVYSERVLDPSEYTHSDEQNEQIKSLWAGIDRPNQNPTYNELEEDALKQMDEDSSESFDFKGGDYYEDIFDNLNQAKVLWMYRAFIQEDYKEGKGEIMPRLTFITKLSPLNVSAVKYAFTKTMNAIEELKEESNLLASLFEHYRHYDKATQGIKADIQDDFQFAIAYDPDLSDLDKNQLRNQAHLCSKDVLRALTAENVFTLTVTCLPRPLIRLVMQYVAELDDDIVPGLKSVLKALEKSPLPQWSLCGSRSPKDNIEPPLQPSLPQALA